LSKHPEETANSRFCRDNVKGLYKRTKEKKKFIKPVERLSAIRTTGTVSIERTAADSRRKRLKNE
jgi:hypothetical protein